MFSTQGDLTDLCQSQKGHSGGRRSLEPANLFKPK
ncbi:MAG: hypothetical protein ACJAT6_000476, partial [Akkermansiaceae bacterium]